MPETVLITGASAGIGYELARCFARGGDRLILVSRSESRLNQVAEELRKEYQADVHVYPADLSKPGEAAALFHRLMDAGLQVDVLVNNAGYGLNGPFVENDYIEESGMVQVNVTALMELCHLFGAQMVSRGRGKILNVASTAAFQPGPLMSNYYATKAYVLSFSEGLAEELRPRGVTVSVLCPGATRTDFFDRAGMHGVRLADGMVPVMKADRVARAGYRGLRKGRVIIIPGIVNKFTAQSVRFTPRWLVRKLAGYLNGGKNK